MTNKQSDLTRLFQRSMTRRAVMGGAVGLGAIALGGCSLADRGPDPDASHLAWPSEDKWPDQFHQAPADIQEAYRYVIAEHAVIEWFPCYCGCVNQGHRSNLDCFVKEMRKDGSVLLDPMSYG